MARLDGYDESSIRFKGTGQNDLFNLEGLDGVTGDGSVGYLSFTITEGRDTVIFPDGGQEWDFSIGSGGLDASSVFHESIFLKSCG